MLYTHFINTYLRAHMYATLHIFYASNSNKFRPPLLFLKKVKFSCAASPARWAIGKFDHPKPFENRAVGNDPIGSSKKLLDLLVEDHKDIWNRGEIASHRKTRKPYTSTCIYTYVCIYMYIHVCVYIYIYAWGNSERGFQS